MKHWFSAIVLMLLAVFSDSENAVLPSRTPFSLTYEYRIDLNVSETMPSVETVIDVLRNDTLAAIQQLVGDGDDPLFSIDALDMNIQSSCQSFSDVCAFVDSSALLLLRANVDDQLVEFAALEEVQSLLKAFNGNHDEVVLSFIGPFVVRTDISIQLEGVRGRMSTFEIEVFETTFMDVIGPPLLNNDPSIILKSATVFLQQVMEQKRRRLQGGGGNESVVVSVHVTGQCNRCSNDDFTRVVGEAVDISRPDLQRDLRDRGQENGTDYFDNVSARITMMDEAPGISDCCLDFYSPPSDAFPYWILIVTGACVVLITTAVCCAACRSKRERNRQQQEIKAKSKEPIAQTRTEDSSEDVPPAGEAPRPPKRDYGVMPHLRKATQQRLARKNSPRASSLTF